VANTSYIFSYSDFFYSSNVVVKHSF
jgi:hypothetical protein